MENIEEEIKEKKSGWTRILLIINLIIWTIILFIWFVYNGVVNAQTINMTNWAWKDSNGNWTFVNTGDTTSMIGPVQLSFNFNDAPGNNNGTVYFEADVTGSITTNDITTQWWTNPNPSTTGTVSKNCTVTQVNYLTNHVRCQLNFTITNTSQNLNVILNFANGRPFSSATASGSTDYQPTNNATTSDIVNQTIQISNQIIQSVKEAINNTTDVTNNVIYQLSNAITNAANNILNTTTYCETIDNSYIKYPNNVINSNGTISSNTGGWGVTDFITVSKNSKIYYTNGTNSSVAYFCFYDYQKNKISCTINSTNLNNTEITVPNNAKYIRISINSNNQPNIEICKTDIQAMIDNQNTNTDRIIDRLYQDHQEQLDQLGAVYTAIQPDDTNWRDYVQAEEDLLDYSNVDFNSIQIDLDSDTNNWVWTTLTSILNTNSLVFGMVISILSIGIFKLILNR